MAELCLTTTVSQDELEWANEMVHFINAFGSQLSHLQKLTIEFNFKFFRGEVSFLNLSCFKHLNEFRLSYKGSHKFILSNLPPGLQVL